MVKAGTQIMGSWWKWCPRTLALVIVTN